MSCWIGFSEDDENLGAEGAVVLPTRSGQRVPPARLESHTNIDILAFANNLLDGNRTPR